MGEHIPTADERLLVPGDGQRLFFPQESLRTLSWGVLPGSVCWHSSLPHTCSELSPD